MKKTRVRFLSSVLHNYCIVERAVILKRALLINPLQIARISISKIIYNLVTVLDYSIMFNYFIELLYNICVKVFLVNKVIFI